ncbi:hypothetical protein AVEN_158148-1 [Araneus ventricosus]|uniref:Gustatory receptor n=1 Tax=Araneus ventricosus TaxID=182803 RepID=A0A4Y2TT05_ARAVE|nr:hypothetical protein AVEN_189725-1 [Araneus ventricosus]GBO03660.1 hypothetical protein AVEN_252065-1 [Araneus ventricosus]GBO03775.1 hypothetical protein AVEN_74428-1 [Araneus ventricosus]GBO03783.1 hypothetical protein AVEN_158148-1 [Araneus ventricosus]
MRYIVKTRGIYSLRSTPTSLKVYKAPRNKNNSFHLLYKTSLALGIPIAPVNTRSSYALLLAKMWCWSIFLHKTVTVFISFSHAHRILPGYASLFAFYFFDSFSYISMLALIVKRRKIYSACKTAVDLAARIDPSIFVGSKHIQYHILLMVIFSLTIIFIFATFFFYQEWDWCMKTLQAPFPVHQYTYTWIVVFSIVSHHVWSFVTSFLSVLLCYNSFLATGGLVRAYAGAISRMTSRDTIIRGLGLFRELCHSVQKIDAAFNSCVFFLFGTVVGNFFAAISVLFSETVSFQTPVARAYVGLTLLGGIGTVFVLSIGGNTVSEGQQRLKLALLEGSKKIVALSPDVARSFTMLSDNIRDSKLAVTGCEMFTVDKGLALTVGGMVITYSFLLFQLSGKPFTT